MTDDVIGVIGGMGPAATQLFYRMVIDKTDAQCDQDHVDMIILNHASMPDRTACILSGDTKNLVEMLIADAQLLEASGAACIVIPCNTSHAFSEEIEKSVDIPLINMVRETVGAVLGKSKVAVLATDGTIQTGIYQKELKKVGVEPYAPGNESQRRIMKLIYDGIKHGGEVNMDDFREVEAELLANSCDSAIMACTELSVLKERFDLGEYYLDAMGMLATRAVEFCGKGVKDA